MLASNAKKEVAQVLNIDGQWTFLKMVKEQEREGWELVGAVAQWQSTGMVSAQYSLSN